MFNELNGSLMGIIGSEIFDGLLDEAAPRRDKHRHRDALLENPCTSVDREHINTSIEQINMLVALILSSLRV